jgi:hypothetical protein
VTGWRGYRHPRQVRRYRRAVRRAFATVMFYREQQAAAGVLLDEPRPAPAADLPDPPHTLALTRRGGRLARPPVGAVAAAPADRPVVLHEPSLGYLGALVPSCRSFHLDWRRVHAGERDGAVTLSLLRERRPTLLCIVPPGAEAVTVVACPRHGSPVLRARAPAG